MTKKNNHNRFPFYIPISIPALCASCTWTPTDTAKESDEDKKHNDNAGKLTKEKDGNVMFTADWRNAELKDFLKRHECYS